MPSKKYKSQLDIQPFQMSKMGLQKLSISQNKNLNLSESSNSKDLNRSSSSNSLKHRLANLRSQSRVSSMRSSIKRSRQQEFTPDLYMIEEKSSGELNLNCSIKSERNEPPALNNQHSINQPNQYESVGEDLCNMLAALE